jgi:UV DNA damage endonuclease
LPSRHSPFRLGFAVKILGEGGLPTADTRRWRSGPSLARSLELLDAAFGYLDGHDIRVFRLASGTIPYGTHPELPAFDYRRQLASCADALAAAGATARRFRLRLSTHPGQYTVLNAPDPEVARKAVLDVEQDAALLDVLGQPDDAAVVVHVGGGYGDRARALDRWEAAWDRLSGRAQARVALENDERLFHLGDVLELHRRTGVRVVWDFHHHRCLPAPGLEAPAAALAAAYATWPAGQRPKVHVSSPRTELRLVGRGRTARPVAPLLDQHADFVTPWDAAEVLRAAPGPLDVMLEAKAKDLAVLWLRERLAKVFPELAAAEERDRTSPAGAVRRGARGTGRRRRVSASPERTRERP